VSETSQRRWGPKAKKTGRWIRRGTAETHAIVERVRAIGGFRRGRAYTFFNEVGWFFNFFQRKTQSSTQLPKWRRAEQLYYRGNKKKKQKDEKEKKKGKKKKKPAGKKQTRAETLRVRI